MQGRGLKGREVLRHDYRRSRGGPGRRDVLGVSDKSDLSGSSFFDPGDSRDFRFGRAVFQTRSE